MSVTRASRLIAFLGIGLGLCLDLGSVGCSPQTGLIFEVQGPASHSSVEAGITELQLLMAQPSFCGRWVADPSAEVLRFSVANRDLSKDPTTILVQPARITDLDQPVRASVLARDATGRLVGVASYDPLKFVEGEVRRYPEHLGMLGRGAEADGPRYFADDGCLCVPGRPSIGNSSGAGCDQRLPPSFDDLVSTAGCELPPGADLPIGVCDGQLYPGERANRDSPCYVQRATGCRIGQRLCNDGGGRAFDKECNAAVTAPVLPSAVLCDAFATCEKSACVDPVACLRSASGITHHQLRCTVPVLPDPKDGAAQPCSGGSWVAVVGTQTGAACIGSMLDGTRIGPVTVGFQQGTVTTATLGASSCPPTLRIDAIDIADPTKLPLALPFSFTLGDAIYDVTLVPHVGCANGDGNPARDMVCTAL